MSRPESELSRADHLATLLVRQHAEQIMADLPREEEWATAQRRDDLAEDVRLFARKRKRDRIVRKAERRGRDPTTDPGQNDHDDERK